MWSVLDFFGVSLLEEGEAPFFLSGRGSTGMGSSGNGDVPEPSGPSPSGVQGFPSDEQCQRREESESSLG